MTSPGGCGGLGHRSIHHHASDWSRGNDIAFTVTVPANAAPGDHSAGIVTSFVSGDPDQRWPLIAASARESACAWRAN